MITTAPTKMTLPAEREVQAAVLGQRASAAYLATRFETQHIQIFDDVNPAHDACVLYPAPLRNYLMWLGLSGRFRARWSREIPSGLVDQCETPVSGLTLSDPDDRQFQLVWPSQSLLP